MSTKTKKKTRRGANTNVKAEAAVRKARAKHLRDIELANFIVERKRFNDTYESIGHQLYEAGLWDKPMHNTEVRRRYLTAIRKANNKHAKEQFDRELDILEDRAAKLQIRLREMEELPEGLFDAEMYAKLSEQYLKYRDRIAKLTGMDKGGVQGGKEAIAASKAEKLAPGQASSQHLHLHVQSVEAFEQWKELSQKGLAQLAHEVLELEAAEEPDPLVTGQMNDPARSMLAPNVDMTPEAEKREPRTSLEALDMLS